MEMRWEITSDIPISRENALKFKCFHFHSVQSKRGFL